MVNLRLENKQKDKFKEFLLKKSKEDSFKFELSNGTFEDFNFFQKENSKIDISPLISCSENFYEDILKINNVEENIIELEKDATLSVGGFSILYIIIKEDIKLNLEYFNSNSSLFIKILVKENKKLTLFENQKANDSYLFTNIYLEKNSLVNHGKILNNSLISHSQAKVKKNAKYNLVCSYYLNESSSYMQNSAILLEEDSQASIIVNGGVTNNSNLINDGVISINQKAPNSSGHQKLNNLILDNTSKIISEPILEIDNNNVSCSHGCTIAQISEEIDFYCNTRGLNKKEAINLFLEGFNLLVYEHIEKSKLE